ncbi:DNA polymerase III delta prime subunit [Clostridium tetanomorphum]|uniref:Uncharacterized protein n=1 Tax=Clostridium tetanomorphum TaxID=1553 RepID=A0A923J379_CLOTT|nr:hypothetical protein [Clostridium tetanomorphum]KAJ49769.1 hypothetical protein CTM_21393 [Clostridium tetanomorphum DSM 665]KAJ50915.1 hypothetical protein CTM_15403 [Clostridium tetanomorphum DSM 665]MBC2399775.1 hypothetical protein [Clostridium tetanomorphum]MBP1864244.1 DNA polymerase III delta prime subunit [Clostridium tetanomorphum]NRS83692.1 DNA polymerase III delta prime subunit [Clostridium tetanomorphum]
MKEMISTLQILEQLNKSRDNIIYTDKEIDEEKENIKEMKEIYLRLKKVLEELGNMSDKEEDIIVEQLIQLHLVYSDFVWQYDQMHDMIKKMIKLYR